VDKKIITIISVSAILLIALGGLLIKSHSEMTEMVEVFTEEKETLLNEYQDLYLDYDSLRRYDTDLNDKLDQERERVALLQEELKTVKATNARRIKELQTELTTMRTDRLTQPNKHTLNGRKQRDALASGTSKTII